MPTFLSLSRLLHLLLDKAPTVYEYPNLPWKGILRAVRDRMRRPEGIFSDEGLFPTGFDAIIKALASIGDTLPASLVGEMEAELGIDAADVHHQRASRRAVLFAIACPRRHIVRVSDVDRWIALSARADGSPAWRAAWNSLLARALQSGPAEVAWASHLRPLYARVQGTCAVVTPTPVATLLHAP